MSPHWSRSDAQCDLWPFLRNQKRKEKKIPPDSGKLAIRPFHPRRRIEVKVCMPGGLWRVVLYFKFYQNRSSGFSAVGGRKSPFPITLASGLYNSLYYRTSRDKCAKNLCKRTVPLQLIIKNVVTCFFGTQCIFPFTTRF